MSAAAFIRLNGRGLNLETAKQTKIRVDDLLKVLRIGRFGQADADGSGAKISVVFPQIPPGMANLSKNSFFVSWITALTRKLAQYPAQKRKPKME